MDTVIIISLVAGTVLSFLGIATVLWKIAKSVTTTQISVAGIETKLTEIGITLTNTTKKIEEVNILSKFNERDIVAIFKRADEYNTETREARGELKSELICAITEIKANCSEIQSEKRKAKLG